MGNPGVRIPVAGPLQSRCGSTSRETIWRDAEQRPSCKLIVDGVASALRFVAAVRVALVAAADPKSPGELIRGGSVGDPVTSKWGVRTIGRPSSVDVADLHLLILARAIRSNVFDAVNHGLGVHLDKLRLAGPLRKIDH